MLLHKYCSVDNKTNCPLFNSHFETVLVWYLVQIHLLKHDRVILTWNKLLATSKTKLKSFWCLCEHTNLILNFIFHLTQTELFITDVTGKRIFSVLKLLELDDAVLYIYTNKIRRLILLFFYVSCHFST